jgi:hypothetical protein
VSQLVLFARQASAPPPLPRRPRFLSGRLWARCRDCKHIGITDGPCEGCGGARDILTSAELWPDVWPDEPEAGLFGARP